MIVKYFDQIGLLEVKYSEELISLLERNDSRYNLTSISTQQFVIVNYTTFYTGNKDDDESSSNF